MSERVMRKTMEREMSQDTDRIPQMREEGGKVMDDLPNPNPEPCKFNRQMLKNGIELKTDEWIHWEVENRNYVRFNSIPKAKRQEIINLFMAGGITIKEVGEKLGVDSDVVGSVIFLNIKQYSYMPEESQ